MEEQIDLDLEERKGRKAKLVDRVLRASFGIADAALLMKWTTDADQED